MRMRDWWKDVFRKLSYSYNAQMFRCLAYKVAPVTAVTLSQPLDERVSTRAGEQKPNSSDENK
tara:strand:- start:370 stop:558 length:189 start_codon:yes stop_codon:yes gene_type:complete